MDEITRAAALAEVREVLGSPRTLTGTDRTHGVAGLVLDAVWPIALAAARQWIVEDCPYAGCIPRVEARRVEDLLRNPGRDVTCSAEATALYEDDGTPR
jgi:hypothetical protein